MKSTQRTYFGHTALLRLYLGYYFLYQSIRNRQRDLSRSERMRRQIDNLSIVGMYPWWGTFLTSHVAPHRAVFCYLLVETGRRLGLDDLSCRKKNSP